jgi:hypothetical protein
MNSTIPFSKYAVEISPGNWMVVASRNDFKKGTPVAIDSYRALTEDDLNFKETKTIQIHGKKLRFYKVLK